jgi:hypothetical protein
MTKNRPAEQQDYAIFIKIYILINRTSFHWRWSLDQASLMVSKADKNPARTSVAEELNSHHSASALGWRTWNFLQRKTKAGKKLIGKGQCLLRTAPHGLRREQNTLV